MLKAGFKLENKSKDLFKKRKKKKGMKQGMTNKEALGWIIAIIFLTAVGILLVKVGLPGYYFPH